MQKLSEKARVFSETYGAIVSLVWKIIVLPICALAFYGYTAYLNTHYVQKTEFTQFQTEDVKKGFQDVNTKLDTILLNNAALAPRFENDEQRLARNEARLDALFTPRK